MVLCERGTVCASSSGMGFVVMCVDRRMYCKSALINLTKPLNSLHGIADFRFGTTCKEIFTGGCFTFVTASCSDCD